MKNTKNIKLGMILEVDESKVEELKQLTHHIDWLLDLDSFPEIKSVSEVEMEEAV